MAFIATLLIVFALGMCFAVAAGALALQALKDASDEEANELGIGAPTEPPPLHVSPDTAGNSGRADVGSRRPAGIVSSSHIEGDRL